MDKQLPDITKHFADWYHDVVYDAELADQAPVRGCIVIRPYGYAIWEGIQSFLDQRFKETGHQNAAFPMLIPHSFFQKEAEHVEGFSPELAMVTHAGGKELDEPLAVRPTSETVIHHMFARWIRSWRDLPMKVNQWCSVMRWEKRPRPFLRTSEFCEKTRQQKFAGAETTHTLEGVMQDGRALQMATSHCISQSFARAFEMSYHNREGEEAYPFLTSWGTTTRLIGAIVMAHGDQKGLVLPPRLAPIQVVIIPIIKKGCETTVHNAAERIYTALKTQFRVELDDDQTHHPGYKFNKWELKGVPVRIEVGPKDVQNNEAVVADRLNLKKVSYTIDELDSALYERLNEVQTALFERAKERRNKHWYYAEKISNFGQQLIDSNGIYQVGWCGQDACENALKEYQASIRCILPQNTHSSCFSCNSNSQYDVIVAKAY